MKSVKSLRHQGFTVQAAEDAESCTEVSSDKAFYYYNPKFAQTPSEVYNSLKCASPSGSRFRVLIAGNCPPDDGEIPFVIVSEAQQQLAANLHLQYREALQESRKAEQKFYDSVRSLMSN